MLAWRPGGTVGTRGGSVSLFVRHVLVVAGCSSVMRVGGVSPRVLYVVYSMITMCYMIILRRVISARLILPLE